MDQQFEQTLFAGMKAEQDRDGPPEGFPQLPMIPGGRYTDPAFLKLEHEFLWQKSWLYALHSDELPNPGDYVLWTKTGSPIIISRGRDNKIRAFYNTCRHRGAPLVENDRGKAQGFFCRYHGWTYDLAGRLLEQAKTHGGAPGLLACFLIARLFFEYLQLLAKRRGEAVDLRGGDVGELGRGQGG